MEEYRFGGGASGSSRDGDEQPQSSSRRYRNSTSSSRRASLPPFLSPMVPSPTAAAFRHRPSIASSITTNGTSTSNSTDDAYLLQRHPNGGNMLRDRDLPGMYSGLRSYTFGSSAPPQPVASSSSSSSNLPPRSSRRTLSRRSSMNASSGIYVGPSHGTPVYPSEYDNNDSDLYAGGSDVGSAYSPEDERDAMFVASHKRWERAMASTTDYMDIDGPDGRRLSRDQGSIRSENKKRERNGHRRGNVSTSTVARGASLQGGRGRGQEDREIVTDDEEASVRNTGRSKMRAIDDGTRRPSLPINAAHQPSLAPLATSSLPGVSNPFAPRQFQYDIRMSIGSATTGPSTPTAFSFAATASPLTHINTHIPTANPIPAADHDSSVSPLSSAISSLPSPASSSGSPHHYLPEPKLHTGNRPRSRSNRAAKPLPTLPLSPTNPNTWVAPWSFQSAATIAAASTETTEMGSESLPIGMPPPNVNPFLSSPPQAPGLIARNPFVRSGTGVVQTPSPPQSSASPPLQPTAVPTSSATADFDLAFILSGAVADASQASHVSDVGTYTARKGSIAPSLVEDSFTRFVNKFDDDFGERRDQWSYQIERASSSSTDGQGDYWRCDNMGRYWVGRETAPDEGHGGGGGGYDGFTPENSITVRICPPEELSRSQGRVGNGEQQYFNLSAGGGTAALATPRPGGSSPFNFGDGGQVSPNMTPSQKRSNVRVQVKKHARAPAFTLYLGPRGPRALSVSRPSILLAPKAYQLHSSTPSKTKVSTIRSKSSMSASSASISESGMSGMSASPPGSRSNSPPSGPLAWGSISASSNTLVGSSSRHGHGSSPGASSLHRRDTSRSMPVTAGDHQTPSPHLTVPALPSRGNSPNLRHQHAGVLPPDPATVSLDQMSVAAATGRMTSVHKQAFDTLSPEDGQAVLEHLKNRTSLGIRLKRAFGGRDRDGHGSSMSLSRSGPESVPMMNLIGSSLSSHSSSGHGHSDHHEGGKDGRISSPQASGSGRRNKDDKTHHSAPGTLEAAFEPPWMLMTPMYVREAVVAAERSMFTGFTQLGLAEPYTSRKAGGKKAGLNASSSALYDSSVMAAAMRRNSVLDNVPNEAMCMVLPLWDLTLDLQEDRRKRHKDDLDLDLDDLDEEDEEAEDLGMEDVGSNLSGSQDPEAAHRAQLLKEMVRRRKFMPPPKVERKYLLAYYVPFNAKRQSLAPTPTAKTASAASHETRPSKKRSQASSSSMKRRNSGSGQPTASKPLAVRSFRVVSRILTAAELRDSGLSPPRNIVDPKRMQQQSTAYYHSSLNYQRMDRRLSTSSLLGEAAPSAFSAVIAVCHDRRKGVEFVPEGLDSLGLCGDGTVMGSNGNVEKLPPLFPPAHMVPVLERLTPPLNAVGKQVVEMIWAGCLALTELGL